MDDYISRENITERLERVIEHGVPNTMGTHSITAEATLEVIRDIPAADVVERPHWIPVTERVPKYGERVLVFGGVTMYVAYYDKNRYGGKSWHKLNSKSHYCNPTHWMPLPEPPKEEGGMSMGIYVSEINMPKGDGSKLILQIFPNGEVYDGHGIRLGITNWAKAVPVPPHGRLIDADALDNTLGIDDRDDYVHWTLDAAPTIIPAEETLKEATNDQNNS